MLVNERYKHFRCRLIVYNRKVNCKQIVLDSLLSRYNYESPPLYQLLCKTGRARACAVHFRFGQTPAKSAPAPPSRSSVHNCSLTVRALSRCSNRNVSRDRMGQMAVSVRRVRAPVPYCKPRPAAATGYPTRPPDAKPRATYLYPGLIRITTSYLPLDADVSYCTFYRKSLQRAGYFSRQDYGHPKVANN